MPLSLLLFYSVNHQTLLIFFNKKIFYFGDSAIVQVHHPMITLSQLDLNGFSSFNVFSHLLCMLLFLSSFPKKAFHQLKNL